MEELFTKMFIELRDVSFPLFEGTSKLGADQHIQWVLQRQETGLGTDWQASLAAALPWSRHSRGPASQAPRSRVLPQ